MQIRSARHQKALDYALEVINKSPLFQYIQAIYLYGSCARGEEKWTSDVDLMLILDEDYRKHKELQLDLVWLRGSVSSDALYDVETDLRTCIGEVWQTSTSFFYKNFRNDAILIWKRE